MVDSGSHHGALKVGKRRIPWYCRGKRPLPSHRNAPMNQWAWFAQMLRIRVKAEFRIQIIFDLQNPGSILSSGGWISHCHVFPLHFFKLIFCSKYHLFETPTGIEISWKLFFRQICRFRLSFRSTCINPWELIKYYFAKAWRQLPFHCVASVGRN